VVVEIVERLTRPADMPYLDWIVQLAVSGDVGALRVKLADNLDNFDPAREHPDWEPDDADEIPPGPSYPGGGCVMDHFAKLEADARTGEPFAGRVVMLIVIAAENYAPPARQRNIAPLAEQDPHLVSRGGPDRYAGLRSTG
jgi:hypothetical protein